MALIKCPECGKEISNKAKQCIYCGYPLCSNDNYKKISCPFSFLNDIDRKLYQRYMTVEINIAASSNSYYDSLMDLTEAFIMKVVDSKKLFVNNGSKKMVASLKEENVKKYFLNTINIESEIYEKIIKLGICINEHKHESERSFNYEDAINNLNLIHTFMSEFYNHELGLKIQSFNRSFYDHLIASSDYEITEKTKPSYPVKGFEDDFITLQFENYKLWIKNKVLIKYVGDEKKLNLNEVEIVEFNEGVFDGNSSLETISLPKSIKNITNQFQHCSNLETITINGTLECIDNSFIDCPSLKNVNCISKKCKSITNSFINCGFCEFEPLSDDLTFISSSFEKCNNLETITINGTLECIDNSFIDCPSLKNVNCISKKCESITNSFINCGFCEFEPFSDDLTLISFSFEKCNKLKSLKLVQCSKSKLKISSSFNSCGSLNSIDLSLNDSQIDDCFSGNPNLSQFRISKMSKVIFSNCLKQTKKIKSLFIPRNILGLFDPKKRFVKTWFFEDSRENLAKQYKNFHSKSKLCNNDDDSNHLYDDRIGVHYFFSCETPESRFGSWLYVVLTKNSKKYIRLNKYLAKDEKSVILPDSIGNINVEVLGSNAFIFENKHEEIILSNNMKKIEPFAFNGCKNIKKICLNDSIEVLDNNCFCSDYNIEDKYDFGDMHVRKKLYANSFAQDIINNIAKQFPKLGSLKQISSCVFGNDSIKCNLDFTKKKDVLFDIALLLSGGYKIHAQDMLYTRNGTYRLEAGNVYRICQNGEKSEERECFYEESKDCDLIYEFDQWFLYYEGNQPICRVSDVIFHNEEKPLDLLALPVPKIKKTMECKEFSYVYLDCYVGCEKLFLPMPYCLGKDQLKVLLSGGVRYLFCQADNLKSVDPDFDSDFCCKDLDGNYLSDDDHYELKYFYPPEFRQYKNYNVSCPAIFRKDLVIRFGCTYDKDKNEVLLNSGIPFEKDKQ